MHMPGNNIGHYAWEDVPLFMYRDFYMLRYVAVDPLKYIQPHWQWLFCHLQQLGEGDQHFSH